LAPISVPPALPPAREAIAPWTFGLTPYGWLPFFEGDVTIKGRTVDVDVTPFEVLEHLDAVPFMGYLEARRGPLALYGDSLFCQARHRRQRDEIRARLNGGANADLDASLTIIEGGSALEVARWTAGYGGLKDEAAFQRYTAVDLLAGARYWHQNLDINLAWWVTWTSVAWSSPAAGPLPGAAMWIGSTRWSVCAFATDWPRDRNCCCAPMLAVSMQVASFLGMCSAPTASILPFENGVTYAGLLGYRALSVGFEKGSGPTRYEFDVVQHGPVVGLTIGF
jgi:hypothetical protein